MTTHPIISIFITLSLFYLLLFNLTLIFWIRPRFIFKQLHGSEGERLSSLLLSKETLVLLALFVVSFLLGVGSSLIKMLNELLLRVW
jgi:hypothetical protein